MFKDALNKAAVNLAMCVSGQTRAIFLLSLETWMILALKKMVIKCIKLKRKKIMLKHTLGFTDVCASL